MNSKIKRILDLSTAFGPSGMEDEVSKLAVEDVKDICDVHDDTMRNTYMHFKQDQNMKQQFCWMPMQMKLVLLCRLSNQWYNSLFTTWWMGSKKYRIW